MQIDDFFDLDNLLFPWGTSLMEVAAHPPNSRWHRADGGWPALCGPCQSAFGLATTECYLRAPAPHKPVLRLDYTLASSPLPLSGAAAITYWLPPLVRLLGPPTEAAPVTPPRQERGSLLFQATWQRPGHRVSLRLDAALHPAATGPTATLALEWQDLERAAQPFLAATQAQENVLESAFLFGPRVQVVALLETQPNYFSRAETALTDPEARLQQAKRALYHTGLYRTPALLHAHLSRQQVALWDVMGDHDLALSTKGATVLLPGRRGPGPRIELVTTRPAKGGGFMSLHVGELVLYDKYQSPLLPELAKQLERRGFATVAHLESHDC